MARNPAQDRNIGLAPTQIGKRVLSTFNPELMLRVVEKVAEGKLLQDITKEPGFPSFLTIKQWIMIHPEAARAYAAAREISAEAFEEKAISMGLEVAASPGTGQRVRAYEVAMNQLRWSASRRNPKLFGDQKQTQVIVPVQINTSLPMGVDSAGVGTEEHPNIYQIEAKVEQIETVEVAENVLESEPSKALVAPPMDRVRAGNTTNHPRKKILTPRQPFLPDADVEARRIRREEQKEEKKRYDLERVNKMRAAISAKGGDPVGMQTAEMKQWLDAHSDAAE